MAQLHKMRGVVVHLEPVHRFLPFGHDSFEAVDKNKDATEEVKKVADDLLVVHAVLKEELSQEGSSKVADRAVAQAGELEKRLTKSAELLDEVNDSLEQAVQGGEVCHGSPADDPPARSSRDL